MYKISQFYHKVHKNLLICSAIALKRESGDAKVKIKLLKKHNYAESKRIPSKIVINQHVPHLDLDQEGLAI